MSLTNFNQESLGWLGEWMSQTGNDRHEMTNSLTQDTKEALLAYMEEYGNLDTYLIYRGMDYKIESDNINIDTLSSWSFDAEIALNFGPNLLHIKVNKDRVLIDTTLFISQEITSLLGGFPDEREVILLPGLFRLVD